MEGLTPLAVTWPETDLIAVPQPAPARMASDVAPDSPRPTGTDARTSLVSAT
ncbi:hypothetical protein ACLQ24_28795 [Micromonospora sp. DT4]|uniref:hypothetical protein n=1 Tax=Micromonospora sp. DT4 TaxID=3393438 RepID=UPI003CE8C52C